MKILEYTGLDTSRVKASYSKVSEAIARHDFRAAQVKKLADWISSDDLGLLRQLEALP